MSIAGEIAEEHYKPLIRELIEALEDALGQMHAAHMFAGINFSYEQAHIALAKAKREIGQ
jgi:hypothetical protein